MFIEPKLDVILAAFDQLKEDTTPQWGGMNSIQMIEHLCDLNFISSGKVSMPLETPEKYLHKYVAFLDGEDKMPKNFKVTFVSVGDTRNDNLSDAIDEFVESWLEFEDAFENETDKTLTHPLYGPLKFDQWKRLHSKHMTHHFEQFGLV